MRRVLPLSGLVLGLIGFGTLGYRLTEGWSWLDCVYMTLMVLTTVGFGEVHTPTPHGKMFSIVLMSLGIGLMLYLLAQIAEAVMRDLTDPVVVRKRKERKVNKLADHVVVCGLGQVGEAVTVSLLAEGQKVVAIDTRAERLAWAEARGAGTLEGDATDDELLRRAGIERARALVCVTNNDPSNLYVVLSARGLNPGLHIIARASDESATRKIQRAGADEVINPYSLSGRRIAGLILNPKLTQFMSGSSDNPAHFTVREVPLSAQYVGQTVAELGQKSGALIVAIWREGGPVRARPGEVLGTGDTLLAVGSDAEIDRLLG